MPHAQVAAHWSIAPLQRALAPSSVSLPLALQSRRPVTRVAAPTTPHNRLHASACSQATCIGALSAPTYTPPCSVCCTSKHQEFTRIPAGHAFLSFICRQSPGSKAAPRVVGVTEAFGGTVVKVTHRAGHTASRQNMDSGLAMSGQTGAAEERPFVASMRQAMGATPAAQPKCGGSDATEETKEYCADD
jgi:hypothetical protein